MYPWGGCFFRVLNHTYSKAFAPPTREETQRKYHNKVLSLNRKVKNKKKNCRQRQKKKFWEGMGSHETGLGGREVPKTCLGGYFSWPPAYPGKVVSFLHREHVGCGERWNIKPFAPSHKHRQSLQPTWEIWTANPSGREAWSRGKQKNHKTFLKELNIYFLTLEWGNNRKSIKSCYRKVSLLLLF